MAMFREAERKQAKLRLGFCGPSGSGKSLSALLVAKGIGGRWAVVDTENHSADLYADHPMLTGWKYSVLTLSPPYEVEKAMSAIAAAEKEGFDGIILDTISHYWAGEGGLLDRQGRIADAGKGNSYTAWRKVTPAHNRFIEKMLGTSLHVIATLRAKTEYVLVEQNGKQVPQKVGLAPVQREGMDYEFTTVFEIDLNHNVQVSKDRTSLFDQKIFTPGEDTGKMLLAWLNKGGEWSPPQKDGLPSQSGGEEPQAKKKTRAPRQPRRPDPPPAQPGQTRGGTWVDPSQPQQAGSEEAKNFAGERTSVDAAQEGQQAGAADMMTKEQETALKAKMKEKGIPSEKWKDFFNFARGGEEKPKTYAAAQLFLEKFESYYALWYRPENPNAAPPG